MKVIDAHAFEDVCISNVTVVSAVRPAGRTTDRRTRSRPFHGLLYIWEGEARFWCDDRQISVGSGELAFIPKHHKYKMQYSAPSNTYVLVNFDMFTGDGEDIALSPDITVLVKDSSAYRIAKIMTGFELCSISKNLNAVLRRKELMYKLLEVLYEPGSPISVNHQKYPQIAAGTRLLEQTYLENLPISKFAEASNISISSFRTLFGKQYGMSPVQYRNNLRIERAVILLSEGSCTVSEAAYACGFENLGYFCRHYKKVTGETPSQTKTRSSFV